MKKFADKICKNKNIILIVTGILLVVSFIGMKLTKINYDILVYLPSDIETIKGQDILTNDFNMGSYSIAVVKDLNSKEILKLESKIKDVDGVNEVMSLYDVLGTSIPVEMVPREVREYLNKDNTDLLFITFNDGTSSETTIDAVREIRNLSSDNVKLGGMSSMVLDTMELSEKEIAIYIVIAVVLCLLVLEVSLNSYVVPVLLLLNIGIAILINLGTNMFLGSISYITKALVAVLQLGVTTDFSIFLYHSYEKKKEEYKDKNEAMSEAIRETFSSVLGSSLTTIVGFLVLCTMELTLGKDLGIVMAKGVLIGVVGVLTIFPSLLLTFDKLIDKTKKKSIKLTFNKFNEFIVNHHVLIFIIYLMLLVPAYLGYKNVEVYYKIDTSLPETLESISSNKVLKDKFNIVSPEIILVSSDVKNNDVNNMILEIKDVDGIDFVLSFSELKKLGITENMLDENLVKMIKSDKYEIVLVNSLYEVASDELNDQIDTVNDIVKKYDKNSIVAGEGPLMKDLINISDTDFKNVNYSSIICVLIVILLVLKSASLPILLIMGIESAIFINMSISYFGGVVLPFVAPIVLGTIQLGATIDYAILLTTTYLSFRKEGINKKDAMIKALNKNGHSILVSGMCFFAATFGVGVYSKLEMVGSLCTLISRGAIVSMLVVITVLPSILLLFDGVIMKSTKGMGLKMKKNNKKKIVESAVALLLVLNTLSVSALTKNETVYGKLNSDGSEKSVIVTENIKNNKNGIISDNSVLSDILNISGDETFNVVNNKVTWNGMGTDIIYEGKYKTNMPINVKVIYKLDGKVMTPEEMLGKKGKVEINIKYINNKRSIVKINGKNETLYTPFVVFMGTSIDGNYNSNITINNGKVNNTGVNNLVMGISSPGLYESLGLKELKGLDEIKINYDTTKFSLPTMYSVVSSKLLSKDDLKVFDKLDTIYDSVNLIQEKMDLLDDGAKKLVTGSDTIKSSLKESINDLSKNNNKNVLSDEEINYITNSTKDLVRSKYTKEYLSAISSKAWEKVSEEVSKDTTLKDSITKSTEDVATNYLMTYMKEDTIKCETGKAKLVNGLDMSDEEKLSCNNIQNDVTYKYILLTADSIGNTVNTSLPSILENVTKSVAASTSLETALGVVDSVVPEVSKNVSNSVRDASVSTIKNSLTTLYNGIDTLDQGINEVSNGISTINSEGIKKVSSLVNGEVKSKAEKLEKLVELGEKYKSISSENLSKDSETKMVLVIDGIEYKEVNNTKKDETKKVSFWTRFLDLFR